MLKRRPLARLVPFLKVGNDSNAVDHKSVGAQVGNFIGDIEVQTIQDGDDGDQRGDRQNHSQ